MTLYRKKPVEVEAIQVSDALRVVHQGPWSGLPAWLIEAYERGSVLFLPTAIEIKTLEGTMRGDYHDWIICGVKGELYPCKPDIFESTYELAGSPV